MTGVELIGILPLMTIQQIPFIRLIAVLAVLFFSFRVLADETSFVREHVRIRGCVFDEDFLIETLRTGLGRIRRINPSLASEIRARGFHQDLSVYCDIGPRPQVVHFDPNDNSIHLLVGNDGSWNTNSNFFHEFLHFAGLHHVKPYDKSRDPEVFYMDPVYACHMTAFPGIAEQLNLDPGIIPLAEEKCATVSFDI